MAAGVRRRPSPDVDLPAGEQATGSYADRETRLARWKANQASSTAPPAGAATRASHPPAAGLPDQLAKENCTDGWRYRAGTTPTCRSGRARRRCRRCNSRSPTARWSTAGRIWEPTLGWGVVDPQGKVVRTSAEGARHRAGQAEAVRLHHQVAGLQPRLGGVRRVRLHRLEVPGPDRRQDRHRRGRGQAGHLLAGHLGADVQGATATPRPSSSSSAWSSRPAPAPPRPGRCSSGSGTACRRRRTRAGPAR